MNRMIGRFLILGVVGLAASLCDQSAARADWPWGGCCGYSGYTYGVGYYPYSLGSFSGGYWPSSYYVGYPSWGSYYWPGGGCCGTSGCCGSGCCGSGCGGSCWGGSCCATSGCGSCCGVSGGCGSGCGLACGPDCCGTGGCGTTSSGCGAVTPAPGTRPKPVPEGDFQPRTYDPGSPAPAERSPRRGPRTDSGESSPAPLPGPTGAAGPPAAGADADPGTARPYARDRSLDGTKAPASKSAPADNTFETPAAAPATKSPSSTSPAKEGEPFETKKPLVPVPQRDTKKKAPMSTPEDAPSADSGTSSAPDNSHSPKKPVAQQAPALTLQDRTTWHLTGVSRPTFGQIARLSAPVPERLTSSRSDWAVLSSDGTDLVRR
jgi:hypothetical protein